MAKLVIGIVEGTDPDEEPGESPSDRSSGGGIQTEYLLFALLAVALVIFLMK